MDITHDSVGGGDFFLSERGLFSDSFHRVAYPFDELQVLIDHIGDFSGGFTGALRQASYFIRHNRKPTSLLSCARRFYRGIECEQVSLFSDLFDGGDDIFNALCMLTELINLIGGFNGLVGDVL